jgi:hypothetical protein
MINTEGWTWQKHMTLKVMGGGEAQQHVDPCRSAQSDARARNT